MHFENVCRFEIRVCPVIYFEILIIKIMEKKKTVFGDIKSILTRDQMKQIKGGSGGGCCAHTAGWTRYQCKFHSSLHIDW